MKGATREKYNNNNSNEAEKKLKHKSFCVEAQRMCYMKCMILGQQSEPPEWQQKG